MENRILIVTISPQPRVKIISWPTSRVLFGDENFDEVGAGDTNGFYDFLRLPVGRIVGIRFTPFVEYADICDSACEGPGLRIVGTSPTASVELFWGAERDYENAISGDQFMDYNYIFKTSAQKFAVTFGFSHLEENEIHDLLAGLETSACLGPPPKQS
jgi:hypothetical protein